LCPPNRENAASTVSSEGCTYRLEIAMELCPAIRASVQASHPDCPSRVRKVFRNEYSTNGVIGATRFFSASAFAVSKRSRVLLLEAGVIYVTAPGRRGPYPALSRLSRALPASFQRRPDPWESWAALFGPLRSSRAPPVHCHCDR